MENIMIYPYNRDYSVYVKYQGMLNGYRVSSLVSPFGWGLVGETLKFGNREYVVTDDFSEALSCSSVVWFVNDDLVPLSSSLLFEQLRKAIAAGKKIIFTRNDPKEYQIANELIPPELNITMHINEDYDLNPAKKQVYEIDTPVIFILGVAEKTDKFYVQVALRECFKNKGYRVSSISSRSDSDLLNMHPIPPCMFGNSISEVEKVLTFKSFLKQLEIKELPDIIIVGIPGGVMPYDRNRHNNYGILAYELSMAVGCDCAVLCSFYNDYNSEYFEQISETVNNRLGSNVKYHHIAPFFNGPYQAHLPGEFDLFSLDSQFVEERIKKYNNQSVYNLRSSEEIERLTNSIIDYLSEDKNAVTI